MKCKNTPDRSYTGKENTPLGKGYSAHVEKEGKRMRGRDGKMYVVKKYKNGKRWTKVVSIRKTAKNPKGWFYRNPSPPYEGPYGNWFTYEDETGEIFNEGSGPHEEKYGNPDYGVENEFERNDPEIEVKFSRFYQALMEWFESQGYHRSDGWKLSLFDCEMNGKENRYPTLNKPEDFVSFDFSEQIPPGRDWRPRPAVYFSNFYDVTKPETDSWIAYNLTTPYKKDIALQWINPKTCKFFVLARFDEEGMFPQHKYVDILRDAGVLYLPDWQRQAYLEINWKSIVQHYCGVSIPNPEEFEAKNWGIWDCPTWAVWNSHCMVDHAVIELKDVPKDILKILDDFPDDVIDDVIDTIKENFSFPPEEEDY